MLVVILFSGFPNITIFTQLFFSKINFTIKTPKYELLPLLQFFVVGGILLQNSTKNDSYYRQLSAVSKMKYYEINSNFVSPGRPRANHNKLILILRYSFHFSWKIFSSIIRYMIFQYDSEPFQYLITYFSFILI